MLIQLQYEAAIREAASILVCNYSSLNMAIDMGFSARKQIASDSNSAFQTRTGQVNQLKELVGAHILNAAPNDIAIRIHLINMLVALLVSDEIEVDDLEDCMDDFMEEHFNVLADEVSHREMAEALIKVRQQLTFCSQNEYDLPSGSEELNSMRAFNAKNMNNVQQMSEYMK